MTAYHQMRMPMIVRKLTLECLFYVDSFLCTCLKIWDAAFRLTECKSSLMRNNSPVLLYINLVTEHDLDLSATAA